MNIQQQQLSSFPLWWQRHCVLLQASPALPETTNRAEDKMIEIMFKMNKVKKMRKPQTLSATKLTKHTQA